MEKFVEENTAEIASKTPAERMTNLLTRRRALSQLSAGAMTTLAGVVLASYGVDVEAAPRRVTRASAQQDIDILNFALNLEYLESEFYSITTSGKGLADLGIPITGQDGNGNTVTPGPTRGVSQVTFANPTAQATTLNIAQDERLHTVFVRATISQLGGTPIAKPTLDYTALSVLAPNIAPNSEDFVIVGGRSFCDVGVSAYAGTARYISSKDVLQNSARILAVEALHAGNLRLQIAQRGIVAPKLDSQDVPPPVATANYFTVDSQALAIVRTVQQVLNVAYGTPDRAGTPTPGGFFPDGVHANLNTLLNLS